MKIVCDSCGAKYAIADEKVRGKVFKIRCKKCSTVIVVRGLSGESDATEELSQPETRTFGYDEQDAAEGASGEAVWHLVIDQDQIGPITEQEVRQRFARGEIDLETYAWREGFGDWAALGTIDAFAGLASAGQGRGDLAADSGDLGSSGLGQGGDMFASASGQGDNDLFGSGGSDRAGDSLFANAGSGGAAAGRMRGERNENSVLFSLNNLAALASDTPKAPAAPAASGGGMAQVGGSEGSGLIDIRSMAQTYMGGRERGGAGQANPLSAFSAVEPVTFATQSPVLLPPTPMGSTGSNKTLYAVIGGLGALLIIGVVVVVLVVFKGDDPTVATNDRATDDVTATPDTPTPDQPPKTEGTAPNTQQNAQNTQQNTDTPPQTGGTNPDTTATNAGAAANTTNPPENTARPPENSGGRNPPRSGGSSGSSSRREEPKNNSESSGGSSGSSGSSSKPESGGGGGGGGGCLDEVGCLLADKPPPCCSKYSGGGGGGGGGGGSRRGGGGGDSNLPEKLTRADITDGIGKVRASVAGCKSKGSGEVKVTVKVEGSGSVGSVTVKSAPNAAVGTCVANAVKKAKFPKTQEGATFTYPFVL